MKKAAIYVRVSSQEQAQNFSIDAQKEKLISYCKAKSWNILDIYVDAGWTGANTDRPGLQKLLNELDDIDIVLVYKLDRLSRSQKDTLFLIEEKFLPAEVDFVSLSESFDTTTPFGKAMIGILSVFAQLERETIKERTKLGKEKRAKEGLFRGGGYVPHGYKYLPETDELVIDEYEAIHVKEIFRLYNKGHGYHAIATIMDKKGFKKKNGVLWQTNAIVRILSNHIYRGFIEYKRELYQGVHEPIIDEDLFNKTQELMKKRSNKKYPRSKYLLTGMIKCGYCGARLKGTWITRCEDGEKTYYYYCYSAAKTPKHMIKDPNCPGKHIPMKKVDHEVINHIINTKLDKDIMKDKYTSRLKEDSIKLDIDILSEQIDNIDKQISKLMDLYQYDNIPANELSKRLEELHINKKNLLKTISEYNNSRSIICNKQVKVQEILSILDNFELIWKEATFEEKRNILKLLIKEVIITNDNVKIIPNY